MPSFVTKDFLFSESSPARQDARYLAYGAAHLHCPAEQSAKRRVRGFGAVPIDGKGEMLMGVPRSSLPEKIIWAFGMG